VRAGRSGIGAGALLMLLLPAAGCAPGHEPDSTNTARAVLASAPSPAEVASATYLGIAEAGGPVTLVDGRWQGKPFTPGSAMRPSVRIAGRTDLTGDLDGDDVPEAAVFLGAATGGSGVGGYVAVLGRRESGVLRTATAPVGDRVAVRDMRIEHGQLVLDVVEFGPRDAMCCPGELATRRWTLADTGLREGPAKISGRLTPAVLEGTEWVLRRWDLNEPAPATPEVTLVYASGRFSGTSGCNGYSAGVTPGHRPGDLTVGPAAGTRRACPDSVMAVESRFLRAFCEVRGFGFLVGQLALSYERAGAHGTLLFERRN
jgi:heat shock protein HslJ